MLTKTKLIKTITHKKYTHKLEEELNVFHQLLVVNTVGIEPIDPNINSKEAIMIASNLAIIMKRDEYSEESFPEPSYDLLNTSGFYTRKQLIENKHFWLNMIAVVRIKNNFSDKSKLSLQNELLNCHTRQIRNLFILEYCVKGMAQKTAGQAAGISAITARDSCLSAFKDLMKTSGKTMPIIFEMRLESNKWLPMIIGYRKKLQEDFMKEVKGNKVLEKVFSSSNE